MTRATYGGTLADVTQRSTGAYYAGPAYFWTDRTGGTQITDVLPVGTGTVAAGVFTTGADFSIQVQGPDGYAAPLLWTSATPAGTRYALHWQPTGPLALATDVAAAVAALPAAAHSGSYADLTNKPAIPSTPGAVGADAAGAAATAQAAAQTFATNAVATQASADAAKYAQLTDARLSDQRTPLDGAVTDAKVSATAAIAQSKIAGLASTLAVKADLVAGKVAVAQLDTAGIASSAALTGAFTSPSQVNSAIQAVVGAAPAALSTLAAIDAQLANDESAAGALTSQVTALGTSLTAVQTTANAATTPAQVGPLVGSAAWLTTWGAAIDSLLQGAITRDSNGAATGASVVWPDGTGGTYSGTASTSFPGAIDSYTVTYAGSTTHTVTQPTLTRSTSGAVTNRPALTVS